ILFFCHLACFFSAQGERLYIPEHFYRDNPEQEKHHFNVAAASYKKFMNIITHADVVTISPPFTS
ncbi:hypothetical protein ACFKPZ_25630, partial [Salmonella enterica subsp. enterica serovar Weslaco]